eukprot:4714227-Amphidinium_carterae.1
MSSIDFVVSWLTKAQQRQVYMVLGVWAFVLLVLEDAITLSARMVDENVLTSVHIEEVTAPPAWTDIIVDGLGTMCYALPIQQTNRPHQRGEDTTLGD